MRTLHARLLSRSLFILAGILLAVGIFQYLFMQQVLYQSKAETIQSQINSIPRGFWEFYQGFGFRDGGGNGQRPMLFFPGASVAVREGNGAFQVLLQNEAVGDTVRLDDAVYSEALREARRGEPYYKIVRDHAGTSQLIVLEPLAGRNGNNGIVQIAMQTAPMQEELLRQLLLFLMLAVIALALGLITFKPVIRRTLHPLSRMITTVEQIDSGSLNERLPPADIAEIDRLSTSFNRMMERLEFSFQAEREAKEQMRRFVADASHELRTPLTSIHGFLEVLMRGAKSNPEQLEKALRSMYSESGRLNKLVRDLLLLARLDQRPAAQLDEGSLGLLVREMEPQLRMLAGERQVDIELDDTLIAAFDPDKIKQIVLNLFQNAVQHTDPKTDLIAVSVLPAAGGVALTVKDNGSGIDKEHLEHIFDRFYRADSSRSRLHGGSGLGLAITRSIVDLHRGRLDVKSAPGLGSEFTVVLPANEGAD